MKLDDKDQRLLGLLVKNAREKNQDLARQVGLSPSACLTRVRRLENTGVIVGYRAIVSRSTAGRRIEGWAGIRLVDPAPDMSEQFLGLIRETPEIIEAHRIAGHYDFAVRICAADLDAWNRFRQKLATLGCESQARFSVLVERLK